MNRRLSCLTTDGYLLKIQENVRPAHNKKIHFRICHRKNMWHKIKTQLKFTDLKKKKHKHKKNTKCKIYVCGCCVILSSARVLLPGSRCVVFSRALCPPRELPNYQRGFMPGWKWMSVWVSKMITKLQHKKNRLYQGWNYSLGSVSGCKTSFLILKNVTTTVNQIAIFIFFYFLHNREDQQCHSVNMITTVTTVSFSK